MKVPLLKNLMLEKFDKDKSFLRHPVMFFSMFYYYIGPLSFVAYFLALLKSKIKLSLVDWFIFLGVVMSILFAMFADGVINSLQIHRFYWGFLIFYLFFKSMPNINFNIKNLLFILITITLIESVLINTIISAELLPNYPYEKRFHFSSVWQRVYGFGGNASVLGVLLVVILSISAQSVGLVLGTFIAIILIGSGSAFASFLIYLIFSRFKHKGFILIIILLIVTLTYQVNDNIFSKVSLEYLASLYEVKLTQIENKLYDLTPLQMFFGTLNRDDSGGDFLWLSFFKIFGIYGVFLMSVFLLSHVNKKNALGIFLIIFFTSHYFVLFSMPGQLIVGYLLALKSKKLNI